MDYAKAINFSVSVKHRDNLITTEHSGSSFIIISANSSISDVLKFVSDCDKLSNLIFSVPSGKGVNTYAIVNLSVTKYHNEFDSSDNERTSYTFDGYMKNDGYIVLTSNVNHEDPEKNSIAIYRNEPFMNAVSKHITL